MRDRRFRVLGYEYTIDLPVLFLFIGASLDVVSTTLFVALNAGTEANFILRELIHVSILFIPVYLYSSNPIYVPFLPRVLRKTLGYTFGVVHSLLALNNFSLVLFGNAFLVDTIGFTTLNVLFFVFGLALFAYYVRAEKLGRKETGSTSVKLFFYLLFLVLIQALYIAITRIPGFLS